MRNFFISLALLVISSPLLATDSIINEYTYEYNFGEVNIGVDANQGNIVTVFDALELNGVNLSISGWADSGQLNSADKFDYDRVISAELQKVVDFGWAVKNSWESDGKHQTIDNTGDYPDFDFILFSFSEAVTLENLSFGWASNNGSQEVSVAALGTAGFAELTSEQSTWTEIVSDAISSSFSISNTLTSTLDFNTASQYWLVGAYNTVFGALDDGTVFNDSFKISGINFTSSSSNDIDEPPAEVSEPGALALMSLGLGLIVYRRKRRV